MAKKKNYVTHFVRQCVVGDFKQLLIFLILLFIFRPYNLGIDYMPIWHLFFTGVLLSAIFNCHHEKTIRNLALLIGLPTFIMNWWSLFSPTQEIFIIAFSASLIFLIFSIFSLLYRVLLGKVTPDILRGIVCVYFMIGFAFAIIYTLLELTVPGAFRGLTPATTSLPIEHYHSEMVYFSFVSLLSTGYGDIVPRTDLSQMFAVSEGIIGQFYLAILVARMVAVYSLRFLNHNFFSPRSRD